MSAPSDPELGPDDDGPAGDTEAGRRSARPLVWLLVAIALLAMLWYISRDRDQQPPPVEVPPAAEAVEAIESEAADGETPPPEASAEPPPRPDPPPEPRPADRPAEPLSRVQPEYPVEALRTRQEGTVLLRVEVDAQGRAAAVEVERSSRSRELDRAARDAVSQWTFQPAIQDGVPVASTVTVPVDFQVE
ncbi:MAG: energy transducer TonB [Gammaproteobacteria bacterium]|nr:energy transducer TonB [Gammaproteobacteria bacterium]